MKIEIIKERLDVVTKQVDISQFHTFVDLKEAMLSDLNDPDHYLDHYFSVIYENFVMKEDNLIRTYQFTEDSVIYICRLEHFIQHNQIVLDMLVVTPESADLMHLIVDSSATIEQIIGDPNNDRIRLLTVNGQQLNGDTIVTDIETVRGYHKLIVSWSLGDDHLSFDDCCECHDKYFMNEFWWIFAWRKVQKRNSSFATDDLISSVKGLRETIALVMAKDERFLESLSSFPPAFLNSRILFCNVVSLRVIDIFRRLFLSKGRQGYEMDFFNTNGHLHLVLYFALLDYLDSRESWDSIDTDDNVTLAGIVKAAMEYWENDTSRWEDRMILFWNQIMMRDHSEDELGSMWVLGIQIHGLMTVKINSSGLTLMRLPKSVESVRHAKKYIARKLGIPLQHMMLINSVMGKEPSEEELIERDQLIRGDHVPQYFFEIILKLDNVDVLKVLGSGAFGEAMLCENKTSKTQFVLKKQLCSAGNLYRDISILSRFAKCFSVARSTGLYCDGPMICLAIEYFPGGTLTSYLAKVKYLSEELTAKIAYQLLVQLAEIHWTRVIHRDIKCDNIVLDDQLNAKFIDFGLSKCIDGLTEYELMKNLKTYRAGTLPYMALEILNNEPYTEKIDIWSFGVTVTEMIAGKRNYTDLGAIIAVKKIIKTKKIEFHPPQPISEELTDFINKCLEPDQKLRPSCIELLNSRFISKYNLWKERAAHPTRHRTFYEVHHDGYSSPGTTEDTPVTL